MSVSPSQLKAILSEADHPLGIKELLRNAGLNPGEQTALKRVLREMVRAGELEKDGKRFRLQGRRLPPHAPTEAEAEAGPRRRVAGRGLVDEAPARGRRAPAGEDTGRGAPARGGRWEAPARPGRAARDESAPRARAAAPGRFERDAGGARFERGAATGARAERGAGRGAAGARDAGRGATAGGRFGRGAAAGRLERDAGRGASWPGRPARTPRGMTEEGMDRRRKRWHGEEGGADPRDRRRAFDAPDGDTLEGILHVHRDGFGFVHPLGADKTSGKADNIFLPPHEVARALDGDRVVVQFRSSGNGRFEGRLLEVKGRERQLVAGVYEELGRTEAQVVPRDHSLPGPVRVPRTQLARPGDVVKVRLGVGAELLEPGGEGLYGEVAGSLGQPGEPSVEVLSIAFGHGFSDEFPAEAMDEADRVKPRVSAEEAKGESRRDLRALPLVTIDGQDARDFDDAVYAEARDDGWRLVVAIADVTHYVREGSGLDAEALRRATSVYLPDRVLPMLPERLSNGICSLKPDEDRLCMVADLVIDRRGRLQEKELYPAVMRSHARCTYEEVQDVLDGKDVPHRNAFRPHFERLWALATALNKMRHERGAIDFDLPEYKVELGEDGRPVRMLKRERKNSHRLVEECMLAANEAVALYFRERDLPSVYRYHGDPDPEKLSSFAELAGAHGFFLDASGEDVTSKELNRLLKELEGHPEQRALNQLLLRSMMQAVYSSFEMGHYGLAAENYLHFTSPIRRYPDLLVHRLLKAHWARGKGRRTAAVLEEEQAHLEDLATRSSERERAAMLTEREVISFYATLLMEGREGEEFAATVASVTDFGFFVELDEEHVEGLVKAETLSPNFEFDQRLHALVLPDGRRVSVGQKLTVRLDGVNTTRRQLDFGVVAFADEEARPVAPVKRRRGAAGRAHPAEAEAPARRGVRATPATPVVEEGVEAPTRRPRGRFVRDGKVEAAPAAAAGRKLPGARRARAETAPEPAAGTSRRHFVTPALPPVPDVDEELAPPRRAPPELEPEADEGRPRSPHPGFDRIRALAAQSRGRPERSQEETARRWGAREPTAPAPRGKGPGGGGGKGGPRRGPGGGGGKAPPRAKGPRRQR